MDPLYTDQYLKAASLFDSIEHCVHEVPDLTFLQELNEKTSARSFELSRHDSYALDQYMTSKLELLPESSNFLAHVLAPDPYAAQRTRENAWRDWIGIIASFGKLAEIAVLYLHHAPILCIISGCCWLYFLLAAAILQYVGVSREYPEGSGRPEVDIIAGQLPTPIRDGGSHKILLGAPQNVRISLYWRFAWGMGSIVTTATVIASYMKLSSLGSKIFAIWVGFQSLWLALRSVFYHFAEGTESNFHHPILLGKTWANLPTHLKPRVRALVLALSRYQMHVHPRGLYCYGEDRESLAAIGQLRICFPLTSHERSRRSVDIIVTSVIGDTLLSSAAWIFGLKMPAMDMYDTCIVILDVNGTSIAIPASRVLTDAPPPRSPDVEIGEEPQYPPKGGSNRGKNIAWWYWIPCDDGSWLQVPSTDMQFLGKRSAAVLTDDEVTLKLKSGTLFVGITEVAHVKETVQNSAKGFEVLRQLLEQ